MGASVEIWKDVPNTNSEYKISSFGRLKSVKRYRIGKGNKPFSIPERLIALQTSNAGYKNAVIQLHDNVKRFDISTLVATIFVENPTKSNRLQYLDGNTCNNHASNLIWERLDGLEDWKDILGYEGLYQISNFGRVYSYGLRGIKKTCLNRDGYLYISLMKNRKGSTQKIHRLVASYFVEKIDSKQHVDHIDCNKLNNHYSNLRWCTHAENIHFAWDNNIYNNVGANHGLSKLSEGNAKEIKRLISEGEKNYILANKFNVKQSTICDIRKGRTWAHI